MSSKILADFNTLVSQASGTAEDYFAKAYREVFSETSRYSDLTQAQKVQIVIEMAKVAASDFNTACTTLGMQHIAEAIDGFVTAYENFKHGEEA
ncbi:hypothetical protein [Methylobacterium aquaticum]|uniref:Uncharacterized protein n=1 Tax=Methylobacterium aquaticum TaxID=270351 RepID=A0A0C6FCD7_9HYPH|nr:hypothetical protein [Methylobacterium aquaticum]BAQ50356.1 hypothetical protein Maq22A_3p50545 [Methylobacterium aquaticum]